MKKLRLKALSIANLRSVIKADLSFSTHGLVGIRGFNRDTGGSSGAGKTSVILATTYGLGYANFPATQMKSWLTEDPMQVVVDITIDDQSVVLGRGKSTHLIDGSGKVTGATAVNKRLQDLLGLSPDLLRALSYRPQSERSAFLAMDDASKKDFLGSVIPLLERFEAEAEDAQGRAREAATIADQKDALVGALGAQVEMARADIGTLTLQDLSPLEASQAETGARLGEQTAVVSTLKEALATAEGLWNNAHEALFAVKVEGLEAVEAELKMVRAESPPAPSDLGPFISRSQECARRLAAKRALDEGRRAERETLVAAITAVVASAEKKIARKKLLQERQEELTHTLNHMRGRQCPTCKRSWEEAGSSAVDMATQLDKVDVDLADVEVAERDKAQAHATLAAIPPFVPDPIVEKLATMEMKLANDLAEARARDRVAEKLWDADVTQRAADIQARIVALKDGARARQQIKVDEAAARVREARISVDQARANQTAAEREAAGAREALKLASAANTQCVAAHAAALARLSTMDTRLETLRKDAAQARATANAEADFAEMVGREGFLGSIFDEILAEIAQETNAILGRVPNTSRVVVRFRSEVTSEKGKTKRSIAAVVAVDGHDENPYAAALSGGMRSSFELAVDLAIIRVLGRRTGAMPGWLFLDEPFEGLGRVEKEAWIEVLKDYASDRLVLVVDHASETKELFDAMIDVSFAGGVTTISQET